MAITGAVDLGDGLLAVTVDHDPTSVATDAPKGSVIIEISTGNWFRKDDDGATTNVTLFTTLPIADTLPLIQGDVDATKKFRIEADTNIPTATTVVMTSPGADFEPDDKAASRTPTAHAASHQNGGADEINVGALSGLLADNQNPTDHAANHTDGVDDIQSATASQKGLATAAQITKLDALITQTRESVTTTDGTLTTIATIALTDDTAYYLKCDVVGRRTDAADRITARREVSAFREAAGAATIQGQEGTPFTRRSDGSYRVEINASGNNILIQVKGKTAHTINWEVVHELVSVA